MEGDLTDIGRFRSDIAIYDVFYAPHYAIKLLSEVGVGILTMDINVRNGCIGDRYQGCDGDLSLVPALVLPPTGMIHVVVVVPHSTLPAQTLHRQKYFRTQQGILFKCFFRPVHVLLMSASPPSCLFIFFLGGATESFLVWRT